jgi:hypothetical protein
MHINISNWRWMAWSHLLTNLGVLSHLDFCNCLQIGLPTSHFLSNSQTIFRNEARFLLLPTALRRHRDTILNLFPSSRGLAHLFLSASLPPWLQHQLFLLCHVVRLSPWWTRYQLLPGSATLSLVVVRVRATQSLPHLPALFSSLFRLLPSEVT